MHIIEDRLSHVLIQKCYKVFHWWFLIKKSLQLLHTRLHQCNTSVPVSVRSHFNCERLDRRC